LAVKSLSRDLAARNLVHR